MELHKRDDAPYLLAALTLTLYVVVYTPMKRVSALCTVVGAVPGALPPVMGWAAAAGSVPLEAWVLFAILFFWQLPHFLAIAWLCRDDYRRAGLPMLSVVDTSGSLTGRQVVLWAATLIPFSLLPFVMLAKAPYAFGALALGLGFLFVAVRFALRRTDANARLLFFGSITYLPLLWTLMCVARR